MQQAPTAQFTLFDLLARKWECATAISQSYFNSAETSVIFRESSGRLSLAPVEDNESPKDRMKVDLETGRPTIQPRSKAITPLRPVVEFECANLPIAQLDEKSFAAVSAQGGLYQITPGGQAIRRFAAKKGDITALTSSAAGVEVLVGQAENVTCFAATDMQQKWNWIAPHMVTCLTISPDQRRLAAWGDNQLTIHQLDNDTDDDLSFECQGIVTSLCWDESSELLACATEDIGTYTYDLRTKQLKNLGNYPAPVRAVEFSKPARALVTSGAYRVVGWDSDELPSEKNDGAPLKIGRSGFVPLSYVAAHPNKALVASGYSSGLLTIAQIGTEQEMMLHQEKDTSVNCLAWASSGEHLAVGLSNGSAAIATFPDQMFKN